VASNSFGEQFDDALRALSQQWDATRLTWTDSVATRFDGDYRRPLELAANRLELARTAVDEALSAAEDYLDNRR
jgi:hypothetical protein